MYKNNRHAVKKTHWFWWVWAGWMWFLLCAYAALAGRFDHRASQGDQPYQVDWVTRRGGGWQCSSLWYSQSWSFVFLVTQSKGIGVAERRCFVLVSWTDGFVLLGRPQ